MPLPPEVVPLVRQFASNSFKFLFRNSDNVADLLGWRVPELAERIDFAKMQVQPESYITPSFTALESDVLLRAPFRKKGKGRIEVFILIENQKEPDELMCFRALRYVVMLYEQQAHQWLRTHPNLRQFRFHPVLPIVFYSGTRTWESLTPIREVVLEASRFGDCIPHIEPLFIDLAQTPAATLRTEVGMMGWILWLIQQSKSKRSAFGAVIDQAIARLDPLADTKKQRWEELLWTAHALVYHEREGDERDQLAERIRAAVRASLRPEVSTMGKTIAQEIEEKGREIGRGEGREEAQLRTKQEWLLRVLRNRFTKVPRRIETRVEATTDENLLAGWLDAASVAEKLSDIDFDSAS